MTLTNNLKKSRQKNRTKQNNPNRNIPLLTCLSNIRNYLMSQNRHIHT